MGLVVLVALLGVMAFSAEAPQPNSGGIERGTLPANWITGASCPETPQFRLHEYNDDFYVLRQSACTNFEKPFLYLIFGGRSALLVDTGAANADAAGAIRDAMARWSAKHAGASLPLIVAHSHGHGDHVAGDAQLKDRPNTTFVAATPEALRFFGFRDWPNDVVSYDLGDRAIDILAIPGHQPASIAIYDRRTGILLTGDTLYPGRLYVRDAAAFTRSVQRLVDFTNGKIVAHVLGAHIENARAPYVDYPEGTIHQPDEHALELGRAHLLELNEALRQMDGHVVRRALRDFTIWPLER